MRTAWINYCKNITGTFVNDSAFYLMFLAECGLIIPPNKVHSIPHMSNIYIDKYQ